MTDAREKVLRIVNELSRCASLHGDVAIGIVNRAVDGICEALSVPLDHILVPRWQLRHFIEVLNRDGDEHGVANGIRMILEQDSLAAPSQPVGDGGQIIGWRDVDGLRVYQVKAHGDSPPVEFVKYEPAVTGNVRLVLADCVYRINEAREAATFDEGSTRLKEAAKQSLSFLTNYGSVVLNALVSPQPSAAEAVAELYVARGGKTARGYRDVTVPDGNHKLYLAPPPAELAEVSVLSLTQREIEAVIDWHEFDAAEAESMGAKEVEAAHDKRIAELRAALQSALAGIKPDLAEVAERDKS